MKQKNLIRFSMNRAVKTLTLVALTLIGTRTDAQPPTTTYTARFLGSNDVKGYSMAVATDGTYDEKVMVGTVFNISTKNLCHFQRTDDTGGILNSIYYNNSAYREIRPVAILGNGRTVNATYYIVAMGLVTSGYDRTLIIPVDKYGNIIGSVTTIYPDGQSMYPMHAILHSNGFLYICGFCRANTGGTLPSYNGANMNTGFVMKVNPTSGTVAAAQSLNTTLPASYTVDYDMATRVYELTDYGLSGHVGDIFVTGGVNNYRNSAAHMATMNVQLDQNLTTATLNHFSMGQGGPLPSYEPLNDEIGMGIEFDPNTFGYVIVSNLVDFSSSTIPSSQLNIYPRALELTYVDKTFALPTVPNGKPRIRFQGLNSAWANHTLKSSLGICDGWSPGATLRIAGFQSYDYNCFAPSVHSINNVGPFLWHTEVVYTGTSLQFHTFGKWTTYYTQTGTGNETPSPVSNNFWRLGGGLSSPALLPAFTTKIDTPGLPGAGKTTLAMPIWNPTTSPGKLNNKAISTVGYDAWTLNIAEYINEFQNEPNCVTASSWSAAEPDYTYKFPTCIPGSSFASLQASPAVTTSSANSFSNNVGSITLTSTSYGVTADVCNTTTNPHYRGENTSVANIEPTGKTLFYPNPASGYVQVALAEDIATTTLLQIVLVNVQGQVAVKIFEGSAGQLRTNTKLNLPYNLPAGIYMTNMVANGKIMHQQKLSILP